MTRVQRYQRGDRVSTIAASRFGILSGVIETAACDPHPPAFAHCAGNSARYTVTGIPGPVWDWELIPHGAGELTLSHEKVPTACSPRSATADGCN